ncbi:hypothetical protein Tco_0516917 [Tanacetum coccineum]
MAVTRSSRNPRPNQVPIPENSESLMGTDDRTLVVSGGPSMVGATATESKKPDVSSSTKIPQALYDAIKDADNIRKLLRKSLRTEYDLKKILDDTEKRINFLAFYYTDIDEELPRGWKYDHNTTIDAYVAKPPTPPKKKKIKRTISTHFHALLMLLVIDMDKANETLAGLPTINGTALTGEEQKVWKNFTRMNIKVEARPRVSFPMDKYLIRVKETDPVVKFIVDFAVDAFNDSYHKYVKEHGSKNITEAVPLVCEYYKLSSKYCFYVTLDAIEQGKPGLYKAAVDCDCGSGARTLCKFALTDLKTKWETRRDPTTRYPFHLRSFHQESEYEKAWSSDESEPEDFYEISGMVHRMATSGGGFDYHNPSSTFHRERMCLVQLENQHEKKTLSCLLYRVVEWKRN